VECLQCGKDIKDDREVKEVCQVCFDSIAPDAILVRCTYNDTNRIDPELKTFGSVEEAMKAAKEIFFSRDFHPAADDIQVWAMTGDQKRIPCITGEIINEWGGEWKRIAAERRK